MIFFGTSFDKNSDRYETVSHLSGNKAEWQSGHFSSFINGYSPLRNCLDCRGKDGVKDKLSSFSKVSSGRIQAFHPISHPYRPSLVKGSLKNKLAELALRFRSDLVAAIE